jgi:hypothetical protein
MGKASDFPNYLKEKAGLFQIVQKSNPKDGVEELLKVQQ